MTKQEFLQGLSRALYSTGSQVLIDENLRYYEEYIDAETASGRSEEEVTAELGDPALIAKSIKKAEGYVSVRADETDYEYAGQSEGGRNGSSESRGDSYGSREDSYDGYSRENGTDGRRGPKIHTFTGFKLALIILAVLAVAGLIVYAVISLIFGVVSLFGPVLEFIIAVGIIVWLVRLIRNRM